MDFIEVFFFFFDRFKYSQFVNQERKTGLKVTGYLVIFLITGFLVSLD